LAAFIGVDGFLYVADHKSIDSNKTVSGPNNKFKYSTPKLLFKEETGGTISTPIFSKNRLIAPLDSGLLLYEYTADFDFKLLDKIDNIQIDATPVVWNGRLYVASLDGYLYCFGEK
jgi:outer membrane protein assembly factor BamB